MSRALTHGPAPGSSGGLGLAQSETEDTSVRGPGEGPGGVGSWDGHLGIWA
jgi:hypothetical protein